MSGYNFLGRFSQMNGPQQQNALLQLPQQAPNMQQQRPINGLLGVGTLGSPFQTQPTNLQNGGLQQNIGIQNQAPVNGGLVNPEQKLVGGFNPAPQVNANPFNMPAPNTYTTG